MTNEFQPISGSYLASEGFDLVRLTDTAGVLTIELVDESERYLEISFDDFLAYRKIDEGDALLTLSRMSKIDGSLQNIYELNGSEFLEWFCRENYNVRDALSFHHYLLVTMNDIIDVISISKPTEKIVNYSNIKNKL